MRLIPTNVRPGRAPAIGDPRPGEGQPDDHLGRGMDIALTLLAFLVLGWLVDAWLGVFPLFTITLVLFASIGTFVRMKYVYDATMERLEAERRHRAPGAAGPGPQEGAA